MIKLFLVVVTFAATTGVVAVDAASNPPGSPQAVAKLVAASHNISSLSSAVIAELSNASNDEPQRIYRSLGTSGCIGGPTCTFGDRNSKKTIVLFGDSHAEMWLPAVAAAAATDKYRVILIWAPGLCGAVALLPAGYSYVPQSNGGCFAWHLGALRAIKKLHPQLVLLGERTTQVVAEPSNKSFSDAQWQKYLSASIRQIQKIATHVVVLEDIVAFENAPPSCLASYPSNFEDQCDVANPNPADPGHQKAEQAAAKQTGAGFIETIPWLCTSQCSPVVGSFITYSDSTHVSATYSLYLSRVMQSAIAPYLKL